VAFLRLNPDLDLDDILSDLDQALGHIGQVQHVEDPQLAGLS